MEQSDTLTFHSLQKALKEKLGIERFDRDTLKLLNLYLDKKGYYSEAILFTDETNMLRFKITVFGKNANIIKKEETYHHRPIIDCLEHVIQLYKDHYTYEEIKGSSRVKVERIPKAAFTETIAGILIHRSRVKPFEITISMFEDKVEITFLSSVSEGEISKFSNPIILNIMYLLGYVENCETGISRIKELYKDSYTKPILDVRTNEIKVVLPVVQTTVELSSDEQTVYDLLSDKEAVAISTIVDRCDFGKSKVTNLLHNLKEKEIVVVEGQGRGTKYRLQ